MHGYHAIIPAAGVGRRMGDGVVLPKSLRPLGGRPLLLYTLDALAERGVAHLTLIVGHGREHLLQAVGEEYRGMSVAYPVNEDFATTEHGWSLYLAKAAWQAVPQPVLFMDADNVFDLRLLDVLLASSAQNIVLVDASLDSESREEELVLGAAGRVSGFVRGRASQHAQCVGGFVGMNHFSIDFMSTLFGFMDEFFPRHGRGFKYERVFDLLLQSTGVAVDYVDTGGLAWVNVNHANELIQAQRILTSTQERNRSS